MLLVVSFFFLNELVTVKSVSRISHRRKSQITWLLAGSVWMVSNTLKFFNNNVYRKAHLEDNFQMCFP